MILKASVPTLHATSFKFRFSNDSIIGGVGYATAGNLEMKSAGRGNVAVRVSVRVRARSRARAGYTKRPMETPGAYQLIDEETGDKFIVWGGFDDDQCQSPIPSKQVLEWQPPSSSNTHKSTVTNSGEHINTSGATVTGEKAISNRVATSFGRLKAHKVRALGRISSLQKDNKNANMSDEPIVSGKERMVLAEHSGPNVVKDRPNVPGVTLLRHVKNVAQLSNISGHMISTPGDVSGKMRKSNADSDFFSRKSFRDLGCADYLLQFLRTQLLLRPSHIQALSFPYVIEGKSCIIADQSGSGKTLAYLLPVVQNIRQDELKGLAQSLPESPRVVILVPTAELGSQVLSNCRLLSKFGVPFRSMIATGGFRQRTQLENLRNGLDVLIATPGRFLFLLDEGFLRLSNLKCVVLDEVDILFKDEDFQQALQNLISSSPVLTQYLFVTATLPVNIYNKLVETFPDCEVIMGPGMHRTSASLEEILIDCSGDDGTEKTSDMAFLNKKSALLRLVEENPVTKTIIFCNKIETCRKVENALRRLKKRVLPFHAALAQDLRIANMEEFCRCPLEDSSVFLVCTDRASRGIDIPGVDQVVLFDFPRDPSEYVRRVGRTARGAGGKGKAFIFAVGKQISLARRIIERNRKGHPLHDVPSNI